MFKNKAGSFGKQVFKHDIQPRRDAADQRVGHSPQQGWLAAPQELVKNQHLAAGFDDPGDFRKAPGRLRDNGKDQVQDGCIKTVVSQRQVLCVTLNRQKFNIADSWQGAAQHGLIQIQSDVMMRGWQVRQVQTCTDARQQHTARYLAKRREAALS